MVKRVEVLDNKEYVNHCPKFRKQREMKFYHCWVRVSRITVFE